MPLTLTLGQAAASLDSSRVFGVAVRLRSNVSIADPVPSPDATDVEIDNLEDR